MLRAERELAEERELQRQRSQEERRQQEWRRRVEAVHHEAKLRVNETKCRVGEMSTRGKEGKRMSRLWGGNSDS